MDNVQMLLEDVQDNINKVPFITINGKTGIILRKYHWSIKSQINLIREALKNIIEEDIFILGEEMSEFKYVCMKSTLNNISNYFRIKDIVKNILEEENRRIENQIEELLLLHK